MSQTIKFIFTLSFFALASGCSTDASIRVKVDVYNGPLADHYDLQEHRLIGLLEDVEHAGNKLFDDVYVSMVKQECIAEPLEGISNKSAYSYSEFYNYLEHDIRKKDLKRDVQNNLITRGVLTDKKKTTVNKNGAQTTEYVDRDKKISNGCRLLYELAVDLKYLNRSRAYLMSELDTVPKKYNLKQCSGVTQSARQPDVFVRSLNMDELVKCEAGNPRKLRGIHQLVSFSAHLRERARYWSTQNVAVLPGDRRVRVAIVNFSQFADSYGRRLAAGTDAYYKQVMASGKKSGDSNRNTLPTSMYLRDSSPTAYINLFEWYDATNSGSDDYQAGNGKNYDTESRIRIVESLVSDTYWTNINTVFANGVGDFSVALIKDDIGNWNIKNYESDPSEILDAYQSAGLAAISTAAKLAKKADPSGASKLLELADSLTYGESSSEENQSTFTGLRKNVAQRILAIGSKYSERHRQISKEITDLNYNSVTHNEKLDSLDKINIQLSINAENIGKIQSELARRNSIETTGATQQPEPFTTVDQQITDTSFNSENISNTNNPSLTALSDLELAQLTSSVTNNINILQGEKRDLTKELETLNNMKTLDDDLKNQRNSLLTNMNSEIDSLLTFYGSQVQSITAENIEN